MGKESKSPEPQDRETDSFESGFDVEHTEIIRPTSPEDIIDLLSRAASDDIEIEFAVDEDNPQNSIVVIKEND